MNISAEIRSIIPVAVIVVVGVAGLQLMLVQPLRTEAQAISREVSAAHTELDNHAPPQDVTGADLDHRHERAQRIVTMASHFGGAELDTLTIHERQTELGRKHSLDIRRMEPLNQGQSSDKHADPWQSFRIEAQGQYEAVARFIIDLENQDELCRIDRLRMTPEESQVRDNVNVSIIISYYIRPLAPLLDPSSATAEVQQR